MNIGVTGAFLGPTGVVDDKSLEEMIFDGAQRTVADAGLTLDDVDAVVVSGTDQVDGRVISVMVTSGAAAGVGRDLTMIASSGEHALIYGYLRLLAGQGRNVLVLGWGKPSESIAPDHAQLVAAEPFILRPTGMNDTVDAALQASAIEHARSSGRAVEQRDFTCWPLAREDLPTA